MRSLIESPFSSGVRRLRSVTLWLSFGLLSGCGLPTWSELIGNKAEQPAAAPAPLQPVQPKTVTPPPPPPPPNPAEVIAAFQAKKSYEIDDAAIAALTSLESGIEDVRSLDLNGSQVTNNGVKSLHKLTHLEKLDVRSTQIDANAADAISQIASLQELRVNGAKFSDQALVTMQDLKNLRFLEINHVTLSPQGWMALMNHPQLETLHIGYSDAKDDVMAAVVSRCPKLRVLVLDNSPVSDAGLLQLGKLSELELLNVNGCPVQGFGLKGGFPALRELGLNYCPINEQGAQAISSMRQLRRLSLGVMPTMQDMHLIRIVKPLRELEHLGLGRDTGLTSQALTAVAGHPALESLDIGGCTRIDDSGLRHLVKCKNLKSLNLVDTACTPRGAAALKMALPELSIKGLGAEFE